MKKAALIFLITIATGLFSVSVAKDTPSILNMHTDAAYILDIDNRPLELSVSNPNVIKVEVITDLYSPNSQIVIKTFTEGISYISYKINNKAKTIKVLVDNKAPADTNLTEIDKVKEP